MKNLIFVLLILILIGCNSTGPESKLDTPELESPINGEYIKGDTIRLDWSTINDKNIDEEEIQICGYFECVSSDSAFIVNYNPANNLVHDTICFNYIEGSSGSIWIPASWGKIVVDSTDYTILGDTIKIFWKVKARASSVMKSGDWSDVESFYVLNPEI